MGFLKGLTGPDARRGISQSSGKAVIKSYNDIFFERTKALRIVVSILAERGFEIRFGFAAGARVRAIG